MLAPLAPFLVAALAPVLTPALAVQDREALLAAVPEDALIVASLASLDGIRARAETNSWWKMLNGPELRPLFTRLDEQFTKSLAEALDDDDERALALRDPRAWLAAVHGPATGFVVAQDEDVAGGGVFVDPGTDSAAFDELWDAFLEHARGKTAESSQEYQGVELVLLEKVESAESAERAIAIFFEVAGVRSLVAGKERAFVLELAQGAIDRILGKDATRGFEGAPALAAARSAAPRHALEVFLDAGRFMRIGIAMNEQRAEADSGELDELEEDEQADEELQKELDAEKEESRRLLELSGLTSVRYAYILADVGEGERLDLTMGMHLPPGSWFERLFGCFRPAPRELYALVPADCVQASIGALDLGALWQLVRSVVGETNAEGLEKMDAGVKVFEGMLGIDLETDLLEQVTGEIASADVRLPAAEVPPAMAQALGSTENASVTVFVLRVEDGEWMDDLISRTLRTFGSAGAVEEEEYQGHTVYFLGQDGDGLFWSCTDEYLVFSQLRTPLFSVLARIGNADLPSVSTDERYKAILSAAGTASAVNLGDARVLTEFVLKGIRVGLELVASKGGEDEGARRLQEALAEFPDPTFVRSYIDGVFHSTFEASNESIVVRIGSR